jgi:hypothetical protein
MGDVVDLPAVTTRAFAQMDDEKWALTEWVLNDPLRRRRLVRTQIEDLLALYRQYPLPEFESVRQILTQLQQAYSDVAPFDHSFPAALDDEDEDAEWRD